MLLDLWQCFGQRCLRNLLSEPRSDMHAAVSGTHSDSAPGGEGRSQPGSVNMGGTTSSSFARWQPLRRKAAARNAAGG